MRRITRAPWQRPRPAVTLRGSAIDPALRAVVRARANGMCECCGCLLGGAFQCHHRKLRSRGGQDSAANLLALCGPCHRRVHGHPAWASEHGFMVSAFEDPAQVPVAVRCERWQLLVPDGTYAEAAA